MAWRIEISYKADKVLRRLAKQDAARILDYLEDVSGLDDPRSRGRGLTGSLACFRAYL